MLSLMFNAVDRDLPGVQEPALLNKFKRNSFLVIEPVTGRLVCSNDVLGSYALKLARLDSYRFVFGALGPRGSGKTTVLNSIACGGEMYVI